MAKTIKRIIDKNQKNNIDLNDSKQVYVIDYTYHDYKVISSSLFMKIDENAVYKTLKFRTLKSNKNLKIYDMQYSRMCTFDVQTWEDGLDQYEAFSGMKIYYKQDLQYMHNLIDDIKYYQKRMISTIEGLKAKYSN